MIQGLCLVVASLGDRNAYCRDLCVVAAARRIILPAVQIDPITSHLRGCQEEVRYGECCSSISRPLAEKEASMLPLKFLECILRAAWESFRVLLCGEVTKDGGAGGGAIDGLSRLYVTDRSEEL